MQNLVSKKEEEERRLKALAEYRILGTKPESCYDDITKIAASICDVPISLMTLVDRDKQWFKSKVGLQISETKRVWEFLLNKMQINKDKKWADLLANEREIMINSLLKDKYTISSKGPFGEEFVTSGGVSINEVNFKSMESLICPGLFFSGEVLDVDGITGGFNFQHCWTSGWLAGKTVSKLFIK